MHSSKDAHRIDTGSISPRVRIVFRITALALPVLCAILLEVSLRWFHYGSDLPLFATETINGSLYYTLSPSVKDRYFSGINFSPAPSPEYFPVSKPPGTYRIFCLGESSTIGYPYWYNGSFPSFLRERLKAVFPDRPIEVVNLGITATNSYTVLDIGRELVDYQPDLIIVYDGHNEFYGMLGSASGSVLPAERWMKLLYLRMIHLRTFQLAKNSLDAMAAFVGGSRANLADHTTLMERVARGKNVPTGGDVYAAGCAAFEKNLNDMSELCRSRGIPLMYGTQVSNIRDLPPFLSNTSHGIPERRQNECRELCRKGAEYQAHSMLDSAVAAFRAGIACDRFYADNHYGLAQCLDAMGRTRDAYPEYVLARDFDELRFRTDSHFNDLIREQEDHSTVFVADVDAAFKSLSKDSLIGRNLILEHLHPNARGAFFLAKEYARHMRAHGLLASSAAWAACDTIGDEALWERRPVTELDELLAARKTEYLVASWPFTDHPAAVAPVAAADTLRSIVEQLVRGQTEWETAHSRAIEYYKTRGDITKAEKECATIISQYPLDVASYLRLGQLYCSNNEFANAEAILRASLQIQRVPLTYRILGDTYLKDKKPEQAVVCYEQLNTYPANSAAAAENAYMLAVAYVLSDHPERAVPVLKRATALDPASERARELLARITMLGTPHRQ